MSLIQIKSILEVKDLSAEFHSADGNFLAVDKVSWSIDSGKTLGIVGESGSGKSVSALSVLGLMPNPPGKIVNGSVNYLGSNLLNSSEKFLRKIRGNEISMIFQDPMTSLNPVLTIGRQLTEVYKLHERLSSKKAKVNSIEILKKVGIPSPERRMKEYPHQLSGGMRQRVMIAMALACKPKVLLADEPTTALDVTIQAQILRLMENLQSEFGMSIVLISHDMGLIAQNCDHVMVMYAGQIMEQGPTKELFENPQHPYTKGLLTSIPKLKTELTEKKQNILETIPGNIEPPSSRPKGCVFSNRCSHKLEICSDQQPKDFEIKPLHLARCWLFPSNDC